jgi:predicted negative regulator of RcsB-dependent stress response
LNLVDALLDKPDASEVERLEAAEVLGLVVDLASDDSRAVPAAIRRARLLNELGRLEEADQTLDEIENRCSGSPAWQRRVLAARMRTLLDRGDHEQAGQVYEQLSTLHPDYELTEELRRLFSGTAEEESR